MRTSLLIILTVVILIIAGSAQADIVELDLLSLGCPTEFNVFVDLWQADFDLGVTFSSIDHVYMRWSGEVTAGLALNTDMFGNPIGDPFNFDTGVSVNLGSTPNWYIAEILDGSDTYPNPKLFQIFSEFEPANWSNLLNGRGTVIVSYSCNLDVVIPEMLRVIEFGSASLNEATLVFEGDIIPEPATILLLGMGILAVRLRNVKR
jgi:hypothetical protein